MADDRFARFEPAADATELDRMILAFGAALLRQGYDMDAKVLADAAQLVRDTPVNTERRLLAALKTMAENYAALARLVESRRSRLVPGLRAE